MTPEQVFDYLTHLMDVTQDQRVVALIVMIFLVMIYVIILASGDPP